MILKISIKHNKSKHTKYTTRQNKHERIEKKSQLNVRKMLTQLNKTDNALLTSKYILSEQFKTV